MAAVVALDHSRAASGALLVGMPVISSGDSIANAIISFVSSTNYNPPSPVIKQTALTYAFSRYLWMLGRMPEWDVVHPHWDRSEWEGDKLLSIMVERLVEEYFEEHGDLEMRKLDRLIQILTMNKVLASVTYRLVHSGALEVAANFTISDIVHMSHEYQSFSKRHDFHKIGGDTFEVLCLMLWEQSGCDYDGNLLYCQWIRPLMKPLLLIAARGLDVKPGLPKRGPRLTSNTLPYIRTPSRSYKGVLLVGITNQPSSQTSPSRHALQSPSKRKAVKRRPSLSSTTFQPLHSSDYNVHSSPSRPRKF